MALLSVMSFEAEDARKLEDARFRALIVATHLGQAKEILAVLDGEPQEVDGVPQYAPEMSEEEMENYEPFSHEEAMEAVQLLRRFGVAVS